MTDALLGTPKPQPTLSERANAPRLGRARFTGNAIGYLLFAGIIGGILQFIVSHAPVIPSVLIQTIMQPSPLGPQPMVVISAPIIMALIVLLVCAIAELAIRRRHDRGASSLFVLVWLELLLADAVLHLFAPPFEYTQYVDITLGVIGLYVFIVLCLLPGTKGPNRYGPDPRH